MLDFDQMISRENTHALTAEGYRGYLFSHLTDVGFCWPEDDLIHMWVADMSFATPPAVTDGILNRLSQQILGYTLSAQTDSAYVSAFYSWCKNRYGLSIEPQQLLTSPGIVAAVNAIAKLVCKPGEKIVTLAPSYGMFRHAATVSGTTMVYSDLIAENNVFSVDWRDLERKLSDPAVTAFILCSPHNPTGRCWQPEELRRFGNLCQAYGVFIISDEIHCDLLRQGKQHLSMAQVLEGRTDFAVTLAPSKTFNMAGLQVSNVLLPDPALRSCWRLEVDNPLSIAGATGAYANGAPWLEELRTYLDGNFALVAELLQQHLPLTQFQIPDATYLAWVNLNPYLPADTDMSLLFANYGLLLEGGNGLFLHNAQGWVRLNLSCPRAVVQTGMERFIQAVWASQG
ncbi:aminotransferase class I/II-fold pyridoxal phosphate-dependent enzyme [Bengtsoniella intestinalis]|uniref:MalY/PatB family protein n=1 Tax=Bengtsoniella intestinalis TaxID=3073143 RepID=UPI00391F43DA